MVIPTLFQGLTNLPMTGIYICERNLAAIASVMVLPIPNYLMPVEQGYYESFLKGI